MKKRKLLILACGRSGTAYISKVFQKLGYDLGHERVGEYGCCSMYFVTPTTDCSIVNKGQKTGIHVKECRSDFEFEHIFHQVRHPLKAIESLAGSFTRKVRLWTHTELNVCLPGKAEDYQCPYEDKLHWAMHYWLDNNELCQEQAEFTYQLESVENYWKKLADTLNLYPVPEFPTIKQNTNQGLRFAFKTKEQVAIIKQNLHTTTWTDLERVNPTLTKRIKRLGKSYGYV